MSTLPRRDLADMQRLILQGFPKMRAARYCFMTIPHGAEAAACDDIASLLDYVGTSDPEQRHADEHADFRICIAFTWKGLQALGLDNERLHNVPLAFREGMADKTRALRLKDEPDGWCWSDARGLKRNASEASDADAAPPQIHVLIALFSHVDAEDYGPDVARQLNEHWAQLMDLADVSAMELVHALPDAFVREDMKGHFGFRDGISQPYIEGSGTSRKPVGRFAALHVVKPGEFILGYANEYAERVPALWIDEQQFPASATRNLRQDGLKHYRRDFGRNGTYLVFRQLHQDVNAFNTFLDEAVASAGPGQLNDPEKLAAKLVGRWRSGAPLTLAPTRDDKRFAESNDFLYEDEDRYGYRCPIGSHVRRSYPRDSKVQPGAPTNSDDTLMTARRRRIIRRGRPYYNLKNEDDRGLHFICLNADIREQFEFVQESWINNPRFGVTRDEVDPIVGLMEPKKERKYTVQVSPVSSRYSLRQFVEVKGGGYFFLPSIRALKFLAQLGSSR